MSTMRLMLYNNYYGRPSHYALVDRFEYDVTNTASMYDGMTFDAFHVPEWFDLSELYEVAKQYSNHKDKIIGVLKYCYSESGNQRYLDAIDQLEKYEQILKNQEKSNQ